jgi:hypothetical protein
MSNPFNSEVDGRCYRFSHLVLLYNWEFQGRKRFEMKARHQVNEATYSLPYPILGRETSAYNTETRAHYGYEATLTCGPSTLSTDADLGAASTLKSPNSLTVRSSASIVIW